MRRIYESNALRRETGPFTPTDRRDEERGPSRPDPDDTGLLDKLVPDAIRKRAISIDVTTPLDVYDPESPVPFQVELHNRMPFGVTITTPTPLLWTWEVNGVPNATRVQLDDPPAESGRHVFASGERKRFVKRWPQRFRVSKSEWERAEPGSYTIRTAINIPEANLDRLTSETEFEISADSQAVDE